MKLYTVELTTTAVVAAESESDAWQVAGYCKREIVNDNTTDIFVMQDIKGFDELPDDWDEMCIPYGHDGNTRIREILEEDASRC